MEDCVDLGWGLEEDSGDLDLLLQANSGLEVLPGGPGVGGLNLLDENRKPAMLSYTPIVRVGGTTGANDITTGNGTFNGWYQIYGDYVYFGIHMVIGSTTVYGHTGVIYLKLPFTPVANQRAVGTGYAVAGASVGRNYFARIYGTDPDWLILVNQADSRVTDTVPAPWTAGDYLYCSGAYRII